MRVSVVLAVELFIAGLAIPAGFARRAVIVMASTAIVIVALSATVITATKALAAAIAIAAIGLTATAAMSATITAVATTTWATVAAARSRIFAEFPFVQQRDVEIIAANDAFIAPNGRDDLAFDPFDAHTHRSRF